MQAVQHCSKKKWFSSLLAMMHLDFASQQKLWTSAYDESAMNSVILENIRKWTAVRYTQDTHKNFIKRSLACSQDFVRKRNQRERAVKVWHWGRFHWGHRCCQAVQHWIRRIHDPQYGDLAPIPDFRFQISYFRFQISYFRFHISDLGFQISDFRFRISDFRFQISDFRF